MGNTHGPNFRLRIGKRVVKVIHNWNTQTVDINLKTNVLLVQFYRRPDKSGLKSKARGRLSI